MSHGDADPPTVRHQGDSVTTGSLPFAEDSAQRQGPRRLRTPLGRWLVAYAAGVVALGALAGLVWFWVVPLTLYQVNAEEYATTSERGLAGFVAGDAWFVLIGLALGILCGAVAWWWFAGLGWPVVPLAVAGATAMALVCWSVGWLLGPGPFEERLAIAEPGQTLPIELTVRALSAVLVWPFGAVLVIMLISSFVRDPGDPGREPDDAAL